MPVALLLEYLLQQLGFLVVVIFYQPIVKSPLVERTVTVVNYLLTSNSQPRLSGNPK